MVFRDFVCESFTSVKQGHRNQQWDWMPFQRDQQKRVEAMADAEVEKRAGGATMLKEGETPRTTLENIVEEK